MNQKLPEAGRTEFGLDEIFGDEAKIEGFATWRIS